MPEYTKGYKTMKHDDISPNSVLPAVTMLNQIKDNIHDKSKVHSIIKEHNHNNKAFHCKYAYINDTEVILFVQEDLSFIIHITDEKWENIWTK